MNDDRARRRRVDGMLRRHATEDYEIAEIEAADMRDIHDVYVNLREFVERIARGEVRHPVPEARRILSIPVISVAPGHQLWKCPACGTTFDGQNVGGIECLCTGEPTACERLDTDAARRSAVPRCADPP